MQHYYWNDWYSGWGWFLWVGIFLLMFSGMGNWGYTYKAHRKLQLGGQRDALDFLNERYARGEIQHDDYIKMKSHIAREVRVDANAQIKKASASPT
jgi:putative membrane protein